MTNLLLTKCNLKTLFPVFALIRITFKAHQKISGGKFHAPHRRAQLPQCHATHRPFHIQKLANDALQQMRIADRWAAIQAGTVAREEAKCPVYTPVVPANARLGDKTFGNASPHLGKASRQSARVFFRLVGRHDNWREACNGVANAKPKGKLNATALQTSNQKVC